MARKKKEPKAPQLPKIDGVIDGAGEVVEQKIASTIEENYMPYAMSVIMSRAIPEIDGFKPSHRKLLYTMYKMGLLTGKRTKSANIVGATMKLNPHGDSAIYDTMVRLSRGYEALLHPYVDSKGNFGKFYSRDMAWAASRYTEAKLDAICNELFRDIDKDTVDFVDNYDNTMKEPSLLPATFPSVLVNANTGIAVGMASNICSFNLREVCETTAALIRDKDHDIMSTLPAPDFIGGGQIIYDESAIKKIYETGRGGIKVRAKYQYDKANNCIDIFSIPPSTSCEVIIEKIIDLSKQGKVKEVADIRDETGLDGLKITIDLKRGADPEKLMMKLFKLTTLQDSFSCNFNVLIAGVPRVMGVRELLNEWIAFRVECVRRRTYFDLNKKQEKLHLLKGLKAILLDIDKAVKIVRETEEESEVVPNLMIGFGIDETQAEYVAEIKLRHLNKEYIINRIADIEQLEKDIAEMEEILKDEKKVKNIIIGELKDVIKKYQQPRKTLFIYTTEEDNEPIEDDTPDFPVTLFMTQSGYFKKMTPQQLRMSGEQKVKEGDVISDTIETTNRSELLFFTDKCQVYKTKTSLFKNSKAAELGIYIPVQLGFDENENVHSMIVTTDYSGYLIMVFENGKVAKVPLSAYETKTNRKKLANAYSDKSPLVKMLFVKENADILLRTSNGRALVFNTAMILPKTTRDTIGVQVFTLKAKAAVNNACIVTEEMADEVKKFNVKSVPASGSLAKDLTDSDQLTF